MGDMRKQITLGCLRYCGLQGLQRVGVAGRGEVKSKTQELCKKTSRVLSCWEVAAGLVVAWVTVAWLTVQLLHVQPGGQSGQSLLVLQLLFLLPPSLLATKKSCLLQQPMWCSPTHWPAPPVTYQSRTSNISLSAELLQG